MIEQAGFTQAVDHGPSGTSSSPVTEGRYFSALKPGAPGRA
jgi:hypothetical protein